MKIKVIDQETKEPLRGAEIFIYSLTGYELQAEGSSLILKTRSESPKFKLIGKGVTDNQGLVELFPKIKGEGELELEGGGNSS